jgi:hypothetical protein
MRDKEMKVPMSEPLSEDELLKVVGGLAKPTTDGSAMNVTLPATGITVTIDLYRSVCS